VIHCKAARKLALLALAASVLAGCQSSSSSGSKLRLPSIATTGDVAQARELTSKADRAFRSGDLERADELYRQSLAIYSSQTGAWNNLGNVLMAQHNYVDAQDAFRRAIDLEPNRPEPYTSLGRLWLEAKYAQESLEYFDQALEIDPRWLPALRGKSAASHQLSIATPEYERMLRTALLVESDSQWRRFFDRERSRVEQALEYEG